MRFKMSLFFLLMSLAFTFQPLHAGDIYTWTDEKGVFHATNIRPSSNPKKDTVKPAEQLDPLLNGGETKSWHGLRIAEFREKYPQYNDFDDVYLAEKLHAKFYSHIPKDYFMSEFLSRPAKAATDTANKIVNRDKNGLDASSNIQKNKTGPGLATSIADIDWERTIVALFFLLISVIIISYIKKSITGRHLFYSLRQRTYSIREQKKGSSLETTAKQGEKKFFKESTERWIEMLIFATPALGLLRNKPDHSSFTTVERILIYFGTAGVLYGIWLLLLYILNKHSGKIDGVERRRGIIPRYLSVFYVFIFVVAVFQVFMRYEKVEIGRFDLRYDRLTSEIEYSNVFQEPRKWERVEQIKDFRKAKAYFQAKQQQESLEESQSDLESEVDSLESKIDSLEDTISDLEDTIQEVTE